MLRPRGALLSLALLHFSDEIVSADALPVPATAAIGDSERKLALDLVGQLTAHFDPTKYLRNIEATVERKVGAGLVRREGAQAPANSTSAPNAVVDLTELLAKSVRAAGGPATHDLGTARRSLSRSPASTMVMVSLKLSRTTRPRNSRAAGLSSRIKTLTAIAVPLCLPTLAAWRKWSCASWLAMG